MARLDLKAEMHRTFQLFNAPKYVHHTLAIIVLKSNHIRKTASKNTMFDFWKDIMQS